VRLWTPNGPLNHTLLRYNAVSGPSVSGFHMVPRQSRSRERRFEAMIGRKSGGRERRLGRWSVTGRDDAIPGTDHTAGFRWEVPNESLKVDLLLHTCSSRLLPKAKPACAARLVNEQLPPQHLQSQDARRFCHVFDE
jgi:hypothetical protein